MALGLPYGSGLCCSAGVTAGMASLAACSTWGRRVAVECGGVRAGWHSETPYVWRVCGSAGVTAGMASQAACSTRIAGVASRAACSTRGGGLRWSAQSCGPDGVGTRVAFGIVLLCRRDRRHGKPGGVLHGNWRCGAQDCVVHENCRYGKPGGVLQAGIRRVVETPGAASRLRGF